MKNTDLQNTDLHFSVTGSGPPLIILHGFFGSGRNWASIAKSLAESCTVYSVDQRNHGESPHIPGHTLDDLVNDLAGFCRAHAVSRPIVLGHSMGGLAAMEFTLRFPEAVRALIVVDIAPKKYAPRHQAEFQALRADLSGCRNRQEVDAVMAQFVTDPVVRQFLQTNLLRTETGFSWRIPVELLAQASFLEGFEAGRTWNGPTLFLRGQNSDYTAPSDAGLMRQFFPSAAIQEIPGAGHWPHFSHPETFLKEVRAFLSSLPPA